MKKKLELDFMKMFCAIFIVYQHTIAGFLVNPYTGEKFHWILGSSMNFTRFSVVVFMILSGYLMVKSYSKLSYKEFYKNKFINFLKIYIGVIFLYILVTIFILKVKVSLNDCIGYFIFGSVFYHTWYLITLLKFYIIFPLIKKIVEFISNKKSWFVIILGITLLQYVNLTQFISYLYTLNNGNIFIRYFLEYLDRSLIIWLYYFVLGGVIAMKMDVIKIFIEKYITFISIIWIVLFFAENSMALLNKNELGLPNYALTSPSSYKLILYIIFSTAVLYYICNKLLLVKSQGINKVLKYLSKRTLGIYVVHPLAITILNLYLFSKIPIANQWISFGIQIITVSITSLLILWAWEKSIFYIKQFKNSFERKREQEALI